jgi:hypothetical protein
MGFALSPAFEFLLQLDAGFPNQLTKPLVILPVQFPKLGGRDGTRLSTQTLEAGIDVW